MYKISYQCTECTVMWGITWNNNILWFKAVCCYIMQTILSYSVIYIIIKIYNPAVRIDQSQLGISHSSMLFLANMSCLVHVHVVIMLHVWVIIKTCYWIYEGNRVRSQMQHYRPCSIFTILICPSDSRHKI